MGIRTVPTVCVTSLRVSRVGAQQFAELTIFVWQQISLFHFPDCKEQVAPNEFARI